MRSLSHRPVRLQAPRVERAALRVFDLGIAPYSPVQALQTRLQEAVAAERIPGVLLVLEHEPVFTLGTRAGDADVRLPPAVQQSRRLPIERSDRGGLATLHAPGQLVSYPIVPLPGHDLRGYVHNLEQTLVVLLSGLGIGTQRLTGKPGLYCGGRKIASIGLRCRHWVAAHGTSLNVAVDLSLFDLIVSCGEPGLEQTSIQEATGLEFDMSDIKRRYLEAAAEVFGWNLHPIKAVRYTDVEKALGLEVPTAGFEPATPGSGGQCSIP